MRKSKLDAAASRRRIVSAAATLFRERGPEQVSVADVMQAADMTHGGFYKHFGSKDALLAAAVTEAFDEKLRYLGDNSASDPAAAVREYIEGYLTTEHVADRTRGCPIAGLTSDAVRSSTDVAAAMSTGAEATIALFAAASGNDAAAKDQALRTVSTMVGAIVLARAVQDETLKADILRVARGLALPLLN